MQVVSCPRCHDEVALPAGAAGSARVRCPLCREEYLLSEVLGKLPPMLELLDPPSGDSSIWSDGSRPSAAAEAKAGGDSGGFGALLEMEGEQETAEGGEEEAESPFAFGGGGGGTATATSTTTRPRTKRGKKSNPVMAILPVVIGGLLAAPLAQLVLWWLPGGYQRDPFELGPSVGRYVPFIVPANLRGGGDSSNAGNSSTNVADAGNNRNRGNTRRPRPNPEPLANNGERTLPLPGEGHATPGTGGDIPGNGGDVPGTGGDVPGTGGELPGTGGEPPAAAIGLKNAPSFTTNQLGARLLAAHEANQEFDLADGMLAGAESKAYFESLCELAEAITFVDPSGDQLQPRRQAVRDLLAGFQSHEGKLLKLGTWGAGWLQSSQRTSPGVFLTGTVNAVEPLGPLFRTEVQLNCKTPFPAEIITPKSPGEGVSPGAEVALLGRVVDSPAEELGGYEGSAKRVVWGGLFVVLP